MFCGDADEVGNPGAVFEEVFVDSEGWFCAGIGGAFLVVVFCEMFSLIGDFYEERIVAHEADDAILAIQRVFTEHFPCGDGFEGRKLVENVFNCCRGCCHTGGRRVIIIPFLFVFATMLSVYGKAKSEKVRRGGICL